MNFKINLRILTKNHASDSKIRFPQKIDFRADGTHESHPTACELKAQIEKLKSEYSHLCRVKYTDNEYILGTGIRFFNTI